MKLIIVGRGELGAKSFKMPKVKIGEKVVAGDSSGNERRDFTDGHKSFDSFAARVLTETQMRERRTLETFERNKTSFIKARNPITGEQTPRVKVNSKGEVTEHCGEPLFPVRSTNEQIGTSSPLSARPYTSSGPRAGSSRSSRSINFDIDETQQVNPLKRTDEKAERITSLQNMQDNISGELEYLKLKLMEKEKRLNSLNARK